MMMMPRTFLPIPWHSHLHAPAQHPQLDSDSFFALGQWIVTTSLSSVHAVICSPHLTGVRMSLHAKKHDYLHLSLSASLMGSTYHGFPCSDPVLMIIAQKFVQEIDRLQDHIK